MLPYDESNPLDIERYAKKLIGKTFRDVLKDYFEDEKVLSEKIKYFNGANVKGGLGNLLEEYYFFYKPNSDSKPDFEKANTELKVTPYERKKSDGFRAGERLVIGMIPNNEPIETDFYKSHVLDKLRIILLILYLREQRMDKVDYPINYVSLFSILSQACEEDLKVIEEDYNTIANKIIQGRAHEISEADTKYLAACTKGSTSQRSVQKQFYSDIPAKRRAYSLKQSYMTYVINHYIMKNKVTYDSIFSSGELDAKNFDAKIVDIINNYVGKTEEELYDYFSINKKAKSANKLVVYRMLGVKTENALEFEKANIVIKTIRVMKNGNPKESMSFPAFKMKDFVEEEFETSDIYNYFESTRFLFVVFKENEKGHYVLKGSKFWNMPMEDLETTGREEWERYQKALLRGVKFEIREGENNSYRILNNLPSKTHTSIFHIRPHASKSSYVVQGVVYGSGDEKDMDELPNGDKMTKQCFWLNNSYVAKIIKDI